MDIPDIPGVCSELDTSGSLRTLLETTGINRDGPWRRHGNLSADIHGYSRRCKRTIGTGFMDDKDASRTRFGVYGYIFSFTQHSGTYGMTLFHAQKPM